MRRFKENTKMNALPNTSTLTPEEIQGKLDALVTEVQSHAPSFLGRFSQNKQQRAFIRRFSFQTSFNDPILSLFDAAGVACPHKRNMVDAFTMAVNYALDPAADYTVGQLAKALGLSGKILTSDTPISEKCKSRCLAPNRVIRILGKEWTNIGLQSAKAIGYFSAANIIARKSITGACDDHAYTYVSYGYGDTYQIKTAFVQGEKHPFKSGRETVFSYDSLSSLAGAKRLTPFELSADDEAKCGFYLGITAKQIREYTDDAIANKKHCKEELALLACLSGFTSYVDEWEELNVYAFEFLELNKALEAAKTAQEQESNRRLAEAMASVFDSPSVTTSDNAPEAAKASAEGVTADKALESAGAKESHEATSVTAPAPKAETATTESAGTNDGADKEPFGFYFGIGGKDAASVNAVLFPDNKDATKKINIGEVVNKGISLGIDTLYGRITVGELANLLGIGGHIAESSDWLIRTALDRKEKEEAVRKARGLDEKLPACQQVNACMDADHLCTYLGKTDGTLSADSAKGLGYFAAAYYLAQKAKHSFAADRMYFYSNRKSPIRTGFVNGQTVFAVCSFPYISCRESGTYQIAGEYRNAGGELIHLNEEQQAKWGFEWGITAEQLQDFTNKAPELKLIVGEINGHIAGFPLFDKTALNQLYCLNAFVQYVAKWEDRNREGFESPEATSDAAAPTTAEAVDTAEPAHEIEPTESAGSTEAPAEAAPAVKSAGAEDSNAPESVESAGSISAESTKATESAGAAEQDDAPAPLVAYFDQLLSESTEQSDGPEATDEQEALQDYFKGMLADDTVTGPSESTGGALAPAGSAALTVPATVPTLVPIVANRAAPSIFRAVSLGLSPDAGANEEPEALEATPLEAAGAGPLAPERGQIEHLSFEYFGHRYQLDYSNEGWRWTFDDYKDQCGRGFCFKSNGMTLAEMLKIGLLSTDARYLGELVAYVENEHQINLGQFACTDLEDATRQYIWGPSFGAEDLPAAKLLGVKIYLPIYKSNDRMNLESRFEQANWQIDIAAYSVPLLCSAGFSKANAAEFIKGWTNAILWRAEEELDRAQTSATAYDDDYTSDAGDFDDIPF